MKRIGCALVLAAAWLVGGCAYYRIQPVAPASLADWGRPNGPPEGYIFYQPELYFSVTLLAGSTNSVGIAAAEKQTVTVTPLYLPNYQKPFRLTTRNFLAKSDFTFNFENGWKLTQISDQADNATVANTLAGQLQTILAAAQGTALKLTATNASAAPQLRVLLFRPVFDRNGYITSFEPVGATN